VSWPEGAISSCGPSDIGHAPHCGHFTGTCSGSGSTFRILMKQETALAVPTVAPGDQMGGGFKRLPRLLSGALVFLAHVDFPRARAGRCCRLRPAVRGQANAIASSPPNRPRSGWHGQAGCALYRMVHNPKPTPVAMIAQPIEPPEIPPPTPGNPTEPPSEDPPGSPQPDVIPPPIQEPGEAPPPDNLPGKTPDEIPSPGPNSPTTPNPAVS
jgi:hypothetical protein